MKKIAVIQQPPVVMNRSASIDRAVELAGQAADAGARLVVFPEALVPGYPAWVWRLRPGSDWGLSEALHQRLLDNAVTLNSGQLEPLSRLAREREITLVCGIHERDSQVSHATLYNSLVTFGPDGTLINHHRKLMPTNPERMIWGFGDGRGLRVVDTPCGRLGSLLCWENFMPLARYALYAQGIEVYVAPTYDSGEGWIGSLQHVAREGCCWVIGAGVALRRRDLPEDLPGLEELYPEDEDWINPGDSVVIAPGGEIVAGPLNRQQEILYAEIDPQRVGLARRTFDVAGHYARPDVFTLQVNRQHQSPVEFE